MKSEIGFEHGAEYPKTMRELLKSEVWDNASLYKADIEEPKLSLKLQIILKSRETGWLIKQLERNTNNLNVSDAIPVLTALAKNRNARWVRAFIENTGLNLFSQKNESLVLELIKNGETEFIRDLLNDRKLTLNDPFDRMLIHTLTANGQAEWIANHLKETRLELGLQSHEATLFEFCKAGLVAHVIQQIESQDIDYKSTLQIRLLISIAEQGEAAWIANKLDQEKINLNNKTHLLLLKVLLENGQRKLPLSILYEAGLEESILDELKFNFAVPELETDFSQKQIEAYIKSENESAIAQRKELLKMLETQLNILGVGENAHDYKSRMSEYIKNMPIQHLAFFLMAAKKSTMLSREIAQAADFFLNNSNEFSIELQKTDSQLRIYGKREDGSEILTFVNDVPDVSVDVWKQVSNLGVPCAPIISFEKKDDKTTRVYSRYCGKSIGDIKGSSAPAEFVEYLTKESDRIKSHIEQLGVMHGHPHEWNFTVEFIRRDYFTTNYSSNINDLAFDREQFSFDLAEYMRNPNDWIPVVRLIDWDNAKIETRNQKSQTE